MPASLPGLFIYKSYLF